MVPEDKGRVLLSVVTRWRDEARAIAVSRRGGHGRGSEAEDAEEAAYNKVIGLISEEFGLE